MPYYLGWDRSGLSGEAGVCIHHPQGDLKKISTVAEQPISADYLGYTENSNANHWKVTWKRTTNGHGITESGSSGSPLLTSEHKVIGQLHGGYASCGNGINEPDWYGKFDVSWTGNNNNSSYRMLSCWLDSLNIDVQTMEGLLVIPSTRVMNAHQRLYSNIRITSNGRLTILCDIMMMGNSRVVIERGGELIVDGGALTNAQIVLKPGAALRILNDGIVETKNGFNAPVGSIIDIKSGKIL